MHTRHITEQPNVIAVSSYDFIQPLRDITAARVIRMSLRSSVLSSRVRLGGMFCGPGSAVHRSSNISHTSTQIRVLELSSTPMLHFHAGGSVRLLHSRK